jgi:dihydrofolate synthase / folylpolyglutamate synthase
MLYTEAVDRLHALGAELHAAPGQPRRKFELAQMRALMAALGDPQQQFRSVLIAGTNGKGSTASTLASILAASGLRTGLYTSPHLVRVNERIRILTRTPDPQHDGLAVTTTLIPDDDFSRHLEAVIHAAERLVSEGRLPGPPSFFETMTAMAFLHFAGSQDNAVPPSNSKVDIAVLEVGLGGRLDATNIVEPVLSIITDISLDHTEWLGHTIAEIAREKAGILRRNGVLVTLPQHPEANHAIGEAAVALNVRAVNAAAALPFDTHEVTNTRNRYPLDIDGMHIEVDSPLAGRHQQRNIALAITAALELRNILAPPPNARHPERSAEGAQSKDLLFAGNTTDVSSTATGVPNSSEARVGELSRSEAGVPNLRGFRRLGWEATSIGDSESYEISPATIAAGIRQTRWPGRLEHLTRNNQHILLDVGHNPAGAWTLRAALSAESRPPRVIIFGCLDDKPVEELAQILFPLFARVLLVPVASPRAASAARLLAAAQSVSAAATLLPDPAAALAALGFNDAVITGSVYLVGEARGLLIAQGWESDAG